MNTSMANPDHVRNARVMRTLRGMPTSDGAGVKQERRF